LAEVHYNLGKVYSIQDDFHRARKEFEKAVRLNPNYMEAYNALGFAMEALGDDAAAFEDYQAALRINEERHGKFVAPYINLSGYYNRRSELDVAVEYAKKALEMNPKSDLAYFQIAKAYRAKEDWNGAAKAWRPRSQLSRRHRSTITFSESPTTGSGRSRKASKPRRLQETGKTDRRPREPEA